MNSVSGQKVETELSARIRELLDTVDSASGAQAKAELEQISSQPEAAEEILNTLVSCLIFSVRCEEDYNLYSRIIQNIRREPDAEKAIKELDLLAFRQARAPQALAALENIPAVLRENLTAAAGKVLRGLSEKELCIVLLSDEAPAWLIRAILTCKKFIDILGQAVCIPYNSLHHKNYSDRDYFADDEHKAAEIMRVIATAEKAVSWFHDCQPEHLPPVIDACPVDAQEFAMRKITSVIWNWPMDKLLGLSAADYFPAWLRKAAEKRFQDIASSAAANNQDCPKEHRPRRPDMQPQKTNESENL